MLFAARYGPPDAVPPGTPQPPPPQTSNDKAAFEDLVRKVMETKKPEHLPQLLGQNIELVVNGVDRDDVQAILDDALEQGGEPLQQQVGETIELILSFTDSFVGQLKEMDDKNKHLLGRIIKTMKKSANEQELDDLMEQERQNFSPGFLRHLEGEVERIQGAPSASRESLQLIQILRTIQLRVVETMGQELGDAAIVLGQLLGYDSDDERQAVMEAGLRVRGVEFAREMASQTSQALSDFKRLGVDGADPELVRRVQGIHDGIQGFIKANLKP